MQLFIQNLGLDNYVVYIYVVIVVERVFYLMDDFGQYIFFWVDIQFYVKEFLEYFFSFVEKDVLLVKLQENEFLMRCIMCVLIVFKEGVVECGINNIFIYLNGIINIIKQNFSNLCFYYYYFEVMGVFVRQDFLVF